MQGGTKSWGRILMYSSTFSLRVFLDVVFANLMFVGTNFFIPTNYYDVFWAWEKKYFCIGKQKVVLIIFMWVGVGLVCCQKISSVMIYRICCYWIESTHWMMESNSCTHSHLLMGFGVGFGTNGLLIHVCPRKRT